MLEFLVRSEGHRFLLGGPDVVWCLNVMAFWCGDVRRWSARPYFVFRASETSQKVLVNVLMFSMMRVDPE
jgi:hypothetical protein